MQDLIDGIRDRNLLSAGNYVCDVGEVTNYTYEERIENAKRNIYLLKPRYINVIRDDMEIAMAYRKGSTQYVNPRLKRAENIK